MRVDVLSDQELKHFIQETQEYLLQLAFGIGYTVSERDLGNAPIDDGLRAYLISFGWHYGHGMSLNLVARVRAHGGQSIHVSGQEIVSNSFVDRDTYRVFSMSDRDRYEQAAKLQAATAIELFIRQMIPFAPWRNHFGICQSSLHRGSAVDLLEKWGDRWICDDCVKALSLSEPIYHRTGEKEAERSERDKMTASLRWDILERDKFTCNSCGRSAPDVRLHVDHKIPIAMGGKTTPENLHVLCADCNLGKSAKMPSQSTMEFWEQV